MTERIDVAAVLNYLTPGAGFWGVPGWTQDEFDALGWYDTSVQKPTWADVVSAWPAVQSAAASALTEIQRAQAYRDRADPLFFKWQRGEATQEQWLAEVAAIRAEYP